ncbi:MAG: chorismate-binding protein [Microthrixaceae bacterium]|nr:chorismate-binding protein [Microthrixaceae bacterium]
MAEVIPSRDDFHRLAATANVIPLRRTLLADQVTPVAVFGRLCGEGRGFLLESVDHGGRWSRWSFVGRSPRARLTCRGNTIAIEGDLPAEIPLDEGVLAAVEALVSRCATVEVDDLPLHSGLVGYLGYDVVREVERLPDVPADDRGWPDAVLSVIGDLVALDHWSQHATIISNVFVPEGATTGRLDALDDDGVARIDAMVADGASPLSEPLVDVPETSDLPPEVRSTFDGTTWAAAVDTAREHILAGDVFQVVLSQRFDFDLDADPFDVYRVLRQVNPSPYMYFVREEGLSLIGCSPEPMVQLLDGRVISRPIAGTRKRGSTDEHDRRLAAELIEHPKERAEHIMLVDLARNDVGRVVRFGTEQVDELFTLERYSHVMHLTSQVSGELAEGLGPIDVLRATLPAGTVSGAPKVRAMEIIDSLEATKRGPYAGVVGYIDFSGNIDTAIAIRTMVVDGDRYDGSPLRACVQAGAGIVADSVAEDEGLECRNKARALLGAVPAAERMTRQRLARAARIGDSP